MMAIRYQGTEGERLIIEQLLDQRIVKGDNAIAAALLAAGTPVFPEPGDMIIEQSSSTNDVFFIISGAVNFSANGHMLGQRTAGRSVGEMSAIHPGITRTATITATANTVLLKVAEAKLTEIAERHPIVWRRFAKDLVERVEEHIVRLKPCNVRPQVFIICASESMDVAQTIQMQFAHENADFTIWSDQVFRASQYPLDSLKKALEESDFAIAIASPEDLVNVRGSSAKQPRDNVLVELGMAIGKLGRERSMLLVPHDEKVKLPSDFKGLTPITYREGPIGKLAGLLGPTCQQIRIELRERGVRTDR